MTDILRQLTDRNYHCITNLFYYANLPYGDVEFINDKPAALTASDSFHSLADVKSYVEKIYTSACADEIMSSYLFGRPLYFEHNGKLYIDLSQTASAGLPMPWESYEINVLSGDSSRCEFEVIVKYPADELHDGPDSETYTAIAVFEDGWKLEKPILASAE